MSTVTINPAATPMQVAGQLAVNPWVIAAVVVVPTFMEVLDTTIANVALRYIAGGLSTAQTDSEWVITSYLAANAIVLPITGWLSATSAAAITSCCPSRCSPSPRPCAVWPPACRK